MTTATKFKATPDGPVAVADLDAHEVEKIRRQKERDERCSLEERMKLCNPRYAREQEEAKPLYKWTITATVYEPQGQRKKAWYEPEADDDGEDQSFMPRPFEGTVVAQNENDAWALLCDRKAKWPDRRMAKPVFTRGAQVNGKGKR
jgi:hypothetical protein